MSHFAKRHYEAIAAVMQEAHPRSIEPDYEARAQQWRLTVEEFAAALRSDNSAFDQSRFIHACKPGSNIKARTAHLKIA